MPHPPKNILFLHSRINAAPWKYIFYTNPAGLRPWGAWVASAAAAGRARRGGPLLGGAAGRGSEGGAGDP